MTDETKTVSKSEERRLKVQTAAKASCEENSEILARLSKVENRLEILIDGLEFAANEVRPTFGFGSFFARVLDAVVKKLR